jgi:YD repeat-containing protein
LLATLLLCIGVAQAQGTPGVPSYVGPWTYSTYAASGPGGVSGFSTEDAALNAQLAQTSSGPGAGNYCNYSVIAPTGPWGHSIYDSNPIEGVATSETRAFMIGYYTKNVGVCTDQFTGAGYNIVRQRLVCKSVESYFDGNCVGTEDVNFPGKGEGNRGPKCEENCGQPITPSTGNMWHVESDFAGSGVAGALSLKRTYNSIPYGWSGAPPRLFGRMWTTRYDAVLSQRLADPSFVPYKCKRRLDTGALICPKPLPVDIQAIPAAVSVVHGDGNEYVFNLSSVARVWNGNANNNDRIIPTFNADNTVVLAWDHVLAADGSTERFAADGRLLWIAAQKGSRQYLTYSDGVNADTSIGRYPIDAPPCAMIQTGPVANTRLPLCVTDNWGRQLQFRYDWAGRIAEMFDPSNRSYLYEYDGPTGGCDPANPGSTACTASNLTKVTYPDGKSHTYIYNEATRINGGVACSGYVAPANGRGHLPNAMTGLIDEKENRYISWTYDCLGRATSSQLIGGVEKVSLAYQVWSDMSTTTTVTHTLGDPTAPTSTVRSFAGLPVRGAMRNGSIDGPCVECGAIKSRSFDANGNVSATTNFTGFYTTYTYDTARNLETQRVEDNTSYSNTARAITTSWHPTFRLPLRIAEPKRITTFTYDASGNLLTRSVHGTSDVNGGGGFNASLVGSPQTWTYTYNSVGQVLTVDGPRTDIADTTTYTYDAAGNLATMTNAVGHVATYSDYDGAGRVGRIVAPGGKVSTLQYTARGQLSSAMTTADGVSETTTYAYDDVGNITKVTLPDLASLTYSYDDAHRLTGITDNLGNRVSYTLDLTGNRISETVSDPGGNLSRKISRVYDTMNRAQQVTGGVQ